MNRQTQEEFDNIIEIDRYCLDDEAENQPRLVWRYVKLRAKAQLRLDEAKANVKVVEADVDADVRDDPGKYGLSVDKKPTEAAIKKAILRSDQMREANKRLNMTQYKVNLLEGATTTLDHRRTSLTILNKQDERGYYSKPLESSKKVSKTQSRALKRNGQSS